MSARRIRFDSPYSSFKMNALILAAGLGTRLKPITDIIPKPLLPIVDRPIIEINIERLMSLGIENIGINLFHKADLVKNIVNKKSRRLCVIIEDKLSGTGGPLLKFKKLMKGDLMIHNCDVLSNINLSEAIRFHKFHKPLATLLLTKNPGTNFFKITKDSRIVEFARKDKKEHYTFTGIAILSERIAGYLPNREYFGIVDDVYQKLIENKESIMGVPSKEVWYDIGNPNTYWQVHHDILNKKTKFHGVNVDPYFYIHHSSVVRTKNLSGFVCIGPNCTIAEKVQLKNTVVFENSEIDKGNFENCLVSEKFHIKIK